MSEMFDRRAYNVFFAGVGVIAAVSVFVVYARYWPTSESPPIPVTAAVALLFVNAINVATRTRDRRHLVLKAIVAALTIAAVCYLVKIGLR